MLEFVLGILTVFGSLVGLGITKGRWLRQNQWVLVWFSVSAFLAILMAVEFLLGGGPSDLVHGMSLGYVLGVTLHTAHHFMEAVRGRAVEASR